MTVPAWLWALTIAVVALLFLFDFLSHVRKAHVPGLRESALWSIFYILLACLFAVGLWYFAGSPRAAEFLAGFVTEKSLSVDNLFVFALLFERFKVPLAAQQKALLTGIVLALVLRGMFIAVGGAVLATFSWVFYLFGIFLVYTAIKLVLESLDSSPAPQEFEPNACVRWLGRYLHLGDSYDGARLYTHHEGKRVFTPMVMVIIALGTTDILFALDSIPAIFGLTQSSYIVFTANVFALLGLVQLYFLLGGLLKRLRYLGIGLALILAFIGVKLVLEAMHMNTLPFINHGQPIGWAPEVPTWLALVVIVGILAVTTLASLMGNSTERHS